MANESGYAQVNGTNLYYETHGDGAPLILLHGGLGLGSMFGELLPTLAANRKVIAVDLQGHGRTADVDRPLRLTLMADDVAALIDHLGIGPADVMGYSMGGGVALRVAIQHPNAVKKLVLMSAPYASDGWHEDIRAQWVGMGSAAAPFMQETPMYQSYVSVAPAPDGFPALLDKMGELLREPYDWTEDVAAMTTPTLLIFGDADSVSPAHAVRFFELLGGGKRDGSWDGSGMTPHRLWIVPGQTHYTIFMDPAIAQPIVQFLDR